MAISIAKVLPNEQETVVALLEQGKLLIDDLPAGLPGFVMAKDESIPVGVAGLESFGSIGLLRSVAVDPAYQNKGVAAQLIEQVLTTAQAGNLQELYLITTTADQYFTRFGFVAINRELVPDAIQKTRQLSALCPSSAIVMKRSVQHHLST